MEKLPAKIENKLVRVANRRSMVLASNEVRENLRPVELMIMEAGMNKAIATMTGHELAEDIKLKVHYLAKDVGIKGKVEDYSVIRFIDILNKYYSNLSTSEVKLAFELALLGELDEFLPTDKNGQPDRNHYQEFSLEYQTKILNAYKVKQSKTWNKAIKELPAHKPEITMEEKDQIHKEFLEGVVLMFEKYRDKKVLPIIPLPFLILNELRKSGLLQSEPEVTSQDIDNAYKVVINSNDMWTAKTVRKDYMEGQINPVVLHKAETDAEYRAIINVFDKLIKQKKNLKDLLVW